MDPTPNAPLGERLRSSRIEKEEHARRQRATWIRRVLLLAVLGLVVWAAPRLYRTTTRWRAQSLTTQAEELLRQQSFPEAVARLESALKIDRSNPTALRLLADVYGRFELPAALPLLRALAGSPERRDDDLYRFIEVALSLQRFDLVETELSRLLSGTNIQLRTHVIATEYFSRLGDLPRALGFANEARRLAPTNNAYQLRAARILAAMPAPDRRNDGVVLLRSLQNLTQAQRIEILDLLSSAPGLTKPQIVSVLEAIPEPPGASPTEYLLRATLRIRLEPKSKESVIGEALARARSGNTNFQGDFCAWLLQNKEHERLLKAFTPEEAAKEQTLFNLYLEALARAGRWKEIQDLAQTPGRLDPWLLEGYRAVAAERLGQRPLSDESWRRAFEAAGNQPNRLRLLGELGLRLDAFEPAIKAFSLLSQNKLHRGSALRRLAAIHERRKDTPALRNVMQLWSAGSDHPAPEQAFCYLSGILDLDLEAAAKRARALFKRMPQRLSFRATLALLELRLGKVDEAARLMEQAAIDPATVTPQIRIVQAMVAAAKGNADQARTIAAAIPTDGLLPQEVELVRRFAPKP